MIDFCSDIPSNLAQAFFQNSDKYPKRPAIIESDPEKILSFGELSQRLLEGQQKLSQTGLCAGDRVIVLVNVGIDFYVLLGALFASGIVPVFIDYNMPRKQFLGAIRLSRAKAVFSTEKFFKYRFVLPLLWGKKLFCLNSSMFMVSNWNNIALGPKRKFSLVARKPSDESLISFTSGSSGRPKAANREHSVLYSQRKISHCAWVSQQNDIELTVFPMVVLNNLVAGVTSILPNLEFGNFKDGDGNKIVNQIEKYKVNRIVAPPSILNQLISEKIDSKKLKSIERLVTGGAPCPRWLLKKVSLLIPDAEKFVVYGSTEAEPISYVNFDEVIGNIGDGYLVGRPVTGVNVKVSSTGEIFVSGPHVIRNYLFNKEDNRSTKIRDEGTGKIWHRTGDLGYLDQQGQIWITGRVSDQISMPRPQHVYSFEHEMENILENRVCLLPGKNNQVTAVVSHVKKSLYVKEQTRLNKVFEKFNIHPDIKFIDKMPVDNRHFWKPNRKKLKLFLNEGLPL